MLHDLKTWPQFFEDVRADRKRFELRKDDRGFQAEDVLLLREWNPECGEYTGRSVEVKVLDVRRVCFGLAPGFCAMSIELIASTIRCPSCNRRFLGDPWVVKAGELYRCRCLSCKHSWEIDGKGDTIKEKEEASGQPEKA